MNKLFSILYLLAIPVLIGYFIHEYIKFGPGRTTLNVWLLVGAVSLVFILISLAHRKIHKSPTDLLREKLLFILSEINVFALIIFAILFFLALKHGGGLVLVIFIVVFPLLGILSVLTPFTVLFQNSKHTTLR